MARARGLDETEFAELGESIAAQRSELGEMPARGYTAPIIPAMRSFLHLCGIDAKLAPGDEQKAGYAFLEAAVSALEFQSQRMRPAKWLSWNLTAGTTCMQFAHSKSPYSTTVTDAWAGPIV
jgi:hypothetical protein